MKKPTLNIKKAWLVPSWATEIVEGYTIEETVTDFLNEKLLFYDGKNWSTVAKGNLCYSEESALLKVKRERESYISFLKENIKKNKEKVKKLEQ